MFDIEIRPAKELNNAVQDDYLIKTQKQNLIDYF